MVHLFTRFRRPEAGMFPYTLRRRLGDIFCWKSNYRPTSSGLMPAWFPTLRTGTWLHKFLCQGSRRYLHAHSTVINSRVVDLKDIVRTLSSHQSAILSWRRWSDANVAEASTFDNRTSIHMSIGVKKRDIFYICQSSWQSVVCGGVADATSSWSLDLSKSATKCMRALHTAVHVLAFQHWRTLIMKKALYRIPRQFNWRRRPTDEE